MKRTYAYLYLLIMIFLVVSCSGGGGGGGVIVATGTATIVWSAPATNNDGSPLDLAGFKIHYGTASGSYSQTVTVANAGATTYTVKGLSKGKTYYFVVTAYNASGAESKPSAEGNKTI
jgi:hypothetical protein